MTLFFLEEYYLKCILLKLMRKTLLHTKQDYLKKRGRGWDRDERMASVLIINTYNLRVELF
jgi:hypothetical protein